MKRLLSLLVWILLNTTSSSAPITEYSFDDTEEITLLAKESILDGSQLAFNNDGYTGNGFIDFGGVGTSASWFVDFPITGFYEVTIRYASKSDRGPMDLVVDGVEVGIFEIEKVANNWKTWREETIKVRINAGNSRKLKLLASNVQGPNVDKMTIKYTKPQVDSDYKVILDENECLEKGEFKQSESGIFEVGFDPDHQLVVRRKDTSQVLWSLEATGDDEYSQICLKSDGSLVPELSGEKQENCDTRVPSIYERNFSFRFGINDSAKIAVFLDPENVLWTGGAGDGSPPEPTPIPTAVPAAVPSKAPTLPPTHYVSTLRPTTRAPTPAPTPFNNPDSDDPRYRKVLSENDFLGKDKNNFGQSYSGEYEVGVNGNGNLVVRRGGSVVWVLKHSNGASVVGDRVYLQNDGNLVMRDGDGKAVWTSKTALIKGRYGYSFAINNCGGVAIFHTSSTTDTVWTEGVQNTCGNSAPQESPTLSPVGNPDNTPTLSPVVVPMPTPSANPPTSPPYSIVIASGDRILERGRFVSSPNGQYRVGLNSEGQLIIEQGSNKQKVWTLMDKEGKKVSNVSRMYMQWDGNLVLKSSANKGLWNSETSKNNGADFRIDDAGQLSINFQGAALWIDGLPRNTYSGPSSPDLTFPLRGYFYYAWYPETWAVGGEPVKYRPNLGSIGEGHYRSGDPIVVENHVKALDYGLADISIVSWWGPSDRLDRARITQLLDETSAQGSKIKWTVYYEDEKALDKSVEELVADLEYLKKWFAWHESWAHKNGKPLVFIWNESQCEVADRWEKAAREAGWYVVLKLFGNHDDCKSQPDSWHQYGVSDNYLEYPSSFTIGPGFFKANADKPDHPRVSRKKFCTWVDEMNRSKRDWNLIVSFNEWGEGTAVESAVEWESKSGYGIYLDCLHDPTSYM